ncbi:MAG: sialate O-acetylesterase [Verrucomicrobiota bacterium]
MVAPLIPYAIKGVIWYQGESNESNGREYRTLLRALITDWRAKWGQGDFPFLIVQLANYGHLEPAPPGPTGGLWPWVREAQSLALALPNTGMAVTIDIGDPNNIHPKDKQDVGARLALVAQRVAYGADVVDSGPVYDSIKVEDNAIRIAFKNAGGGLMMGKPAAPRDELTGFGIAGGGPAMALGQGGNRWRHRGGL